MRIAFVNDTFLEGRGADTLIYELARNLGKKHQVYVLAGEANFKEKNFKILNLNLPKLYTGKLSDFNYFGKIRNLKEQLEQIQKKYHFEVFNVHHIALNQAFKGLPTIATWLGSPPTRNIFRKLIAKSWISSLKRNKETIVISNYLKKQLDKRRIKSHVIYCGVSKEFAPSKIDESYMLYVGRLEKHKNVWELIKMSRELGYPLKIGGYGPEEKKLRKFANKIRAPVDFLGRVSRKELIRLYQRCSFFVSASKWEGFGLIFLEAAACGKPSVAYNRGSIPEIIINGKTGFTANNSNEFKNFCEEMINNKVLRKKLGANALKNSKNYSWDKIVKKYMEVFKEIK